MDLKKFLAGSFAGVFIAGAFVTAPVFATQKTNLTGNQWRLLDVVTLPNGGTNFMTSHPSYSGGVASFTLPASADGYMVYMLGNYNNDLTDKAIKVTADWNKSDGYTTRSQNCGGAYGRIELQDTTSGTYNSNDYWRYTGQVFDLNKQQSGTVMAPLDDRAHWINQSGKPATDTGINWKELQGDIVATSPYDGFTSAIKNIKQLGLAFGSSCRYASGVANDNNAVFNLEDYSISVPTYQDVETIFINSANMNGSNSTVSLDPDSLYRFNVSGTWQNNVFNTADAQYMSTNGWSTYSEGWPGLGSNEFKLQVNDGFVNWGAYNPNHDYSYYTVGTGSTVNFRIFDGNSAVANPQPSLGWYGDNSGYLTVNIYQLK